MLKELIDTGAVTLGVEMENKDAVLAESARLLSLGVDGLDAETVYGLLSKREALGSTGIGDGIAIPHATNEGLNEFHLALITVPKGVDFYAIDGKPVRVVFAMLGPAAKRSTHVRILAALSRLSKKPHFIDTLIDARSGEEVTALLDETEENGGDEIKSVEKSLLVAMVQNQAYFEPLLEVLASGTGAGITVLEGHGAGRYLHAMPLFSVFWTDENQKDDIRVVLAVIDRHTGNETIRRISTTVANPGKDTGLLVGIQDLSLVSGSLDL